MRSKRHGPEAQKQGLYQAKRGTSADGTVPAFGLFAKSTLPNSTNAARCRRGILVCPAVVIALILTSTLAHAATIQSNGTGGGEWTTGASWNGGVAPASTDTVEIVSGDVITLTTTGNIFHTGNITIQPGAEFSAFDPGTGRPYFECSQLTNNGTISLDDARFDIGSFARQGAVLTNTATGTITITGALGRLIVSSTSSLINQGSVTSTSPLLLIMLGSLLNEVNASFVVNRLEVINESWGPPASLVNDGSMTVGESDDPPDVVVALNSGTSVVNNGQFDYRGGTALVRSFTNFGVLNIDGGSFFMDADSEPGFVENRGTLNVMADAVLSIRGALVLNYGAIDVANAGRLLMGGTAPIAEMRNEASGSIIVNSTASFEVRDSGRLVNLGTIDHLASSNSFFIMGTFVNEEGGHFIASGAAGISLRFDGFFLNRGLVTNNGAISFTEQASFSNVSGTIINESSISTVPGTTFTNGFCGRITNNATFTNGGDLFNCGLIDGTSGISGNAPITSSCGGGAPDAILEFMVKEAGTLTPITNAQITVERSCIPVGLSAPFVGLFLGEATYISANLEPSQYDVTVSAPGYLIATPPVVVLGPAEFRSIEVLLTPDPAPGATNTIELTIELEPGAFLLTKNVQLDQGGTITSPLVTIEGNTMSLLNVGSGSFDVLVASDDYTVTMPAVAGLTSNDTARSDGTATRDITDSGTIEGNIRRLDGSTDFSNILVIIREASPDLAELVDFNQLELALQLDQTFMAPVGGEPATVKKYLHEIEVGRYFVAVTNLDGSILSGPLEKTVDPSPAISTVPDLEIEFPIDDADGDRMEDGWEASNGLLSTSALCLDGAEGDPDADGLTNLEEYTISTFGAYIVHPLLPNTDFDDFDDGDEVHGGSNPGTTPVAGVPETPPAIPSETPVVVRFDYVPIEDFVDCNWDQVIQVGTNAMPFQKIADAMARATAGGTLVLRNDVSQVTTTETLTLNKALTLTVSDPAGPSVKIGVAP